MKNRKNERALFDAVTGIDADLIDEAAAPIARTFPQRLLRVAAIAAVFAVLLTAALWPKADENYITAPGLLTVHAHGVDEDGNATVESVILEEGVEFTPNVHFDPALSYREYLPISFCIDESQYPGMEITMDVSTNAGILYKNLPFDHSHLNMNAVDQLLYHYYGQHFTASIDKSLYWIPLGFDYDYLFDQVALGNNDPKSALRGFYFENNPSYIDVIFRANDLIIGYCVVEITETNGITGYWAKDFCFKVLEIASFPMVDGQWQNVKLEYVQDKINQLHTQKEELP